MESQSSFFYKFFTFVYADYASPLTKKNYLVAPQVFFTVLQIGSLIPSVIRTENLKTIFHEMVYEEGGYIEYLRLVPILHSNALISSLVIFVFLFVATVSFCALHYQAIRTDNFGISQFPCMFLMTIFSIFFNLMLIPTLDLCVINFKCSETDDCFTLSHFGRMLIAPFILLLLVVIDILIRYFSTDLHYTTKNLSTKKSTRLTRLNLPILLILCVMYELSFSSNAFRIAANLIHLMTSIWFMIDYLTYFHFDDFLVTYIYYLGLVLLLWESTLNTIHAFWDMFGSIIDLDLLTVSIFWGVCRLFLGLRSKFRGRILDMNFHQIKNSKNSLLYIKFITLMMQTLDRSYAVKFDLLAIVGQHISNCQVPKCSCKLLKVYRSWYKSQVAEITTIEISKKTTINSFQTSLSRTSTQMKVDKKLTDNNIQLESVLSYEINLQNEIMLKMLTSFIILTVTRHKILSEELAFAFLSFMIYENKNLHESFIGLQEIRYRWRKSGGINKRIMLQNFETILLQMANRKIATKSHLFVQSLSLKALNYYEKIESLEERTKNLIYQKIQFLKKLQQPLVVFEEVKTLGLVAVEQTDCLSKDMTELIHCNKKHSKLLRLYILFKAKVLLQPESLQEVCDTFNDVQRKLKEPSKLENCFLKESSDIYDERNIFLFARVRFNNFQLRSFTSNALSFFGYRDQKEMTGLQISALMPLPVGLKHSKILRNKRMRTKNDKIYGFATHPAHMITKDGYAKPVKLWSKYDVNNPRGIFAVSLIRPIYNSKLSTHDLILAMDGRILNLPEKLDHLFPFKRNYQDFYIFQFIPRIASFLFNKCAGIETRTSRMLSSTNDVDMFYEPSKGTFSRKKSQRSFRSFTSRKTNKSSLSRSRSISSSSKRAARRKALEVFSKKPVLNSQALFFVNNSDEFACEPGEKWTPKKIEYLSQSEVEMKITNCRDTILKRTSALFRLEFDLKYVAFFDEKIQYRVLTIRKIEKLNYLYISLLHLLSNGFEGEIRRELLAMKPSALRILYFDIKNFYQAILLKSAVMFSQTGSGPKMPSILFGKMQRKPETLPDLVKNDDFSSSGSDLVDEDGMEGSIEAKKTHKGSQPEIKAPKEVQKTEKETIVMKFFGVSMDEFYKVLKEAKNKEEAKKIFIFREKEELEIEEPNLREANPDQKDQQEEIVLENAMELVQTESIGSVNGNSATTYNDFLLNRRSKTNVYWIGYIMIVGFVTIIAFSVTILLASQLFSKRYERTLTSNVLTDSLIPFSFVYTEYLVHFLRSNRFIEDKYSWSFDMWIESSNEMLTEAKYEYINSDNFFIQNFLDSFFNLSLPSITDKGMNENGGIEDITMLVVLDYFKVLLNQINSDSNEEMENLTLSELELIQFNYWVFTAELLDIYVETSEQILSSKSLLFSLLLLNFSLTVILIFTINGIILVTYVRIFVNIDNAIWVMTKVEHRVLEKWIRHFESVLPEVDSKEDTKKHKSTAKKATEDSKFSSKKSKAAMFASDYVKVKRPHFIVLLIVAISSGVLLSIPTLVSFYFGQSIYVKDQIFMSMRDEVLELSVRSGQITNSVFQKVISYENSTFDSEMFQEGLQIASNSLSNLKANLDDLISFMSSKVEGYLDSDSELYSFLSAVEQGDFCSETELSSEHQSRCVELADSLGDLGILVATNQFYSVFSTLLVDLYSVEGTFANKQRLLNSEPFLEYTELSKYFEVIFIRIGDLIREEIFSMSQVRIVINWICFGVTVLFFVVYFFIGLNKILIRISMDISKTQRVISLFPYDVISSNNYLKNYLKTHFRSA